MKHKVLLIAIAAGVLPHSPLKAEVDFATQIYPILKNRCIECHGPEKQKGKLRLDNQEDAHDDWSIVPGDAEESEVIYRVTLDADDDDIMPPKGDPLTEEEIALLREWIDTGAVYTEVSEEEPAIDPAIVDSAPDYDFEADIRPILDGLDEAQKEKLLAWAAAGGVLPPMEAAEPSLSEFEVTAEEEDALESIQATGALAMRVAQNVDFAMANFRLVGDTIDDDAIAPVAQVKNLIDLDLSKTKITDGGVASLAGLSNLTRLDLNNTSITDAALDHVAQLNNLVYLNLYGTQVTDAGIAKLSGLKSLKKLFLWQTQVTAEGAQALNSELPWLDINLGIELEQPAEEEAQEEEAVEEAAAETAVEAEAPAEEQKAVAEAAEESPSPGFSTSKALLFLAGVR